jgi:hypothetical protein
MKYVIFILLLFFLPIVSAYDINSTVNIQAEYKVNGTLTTASANLSIQYPDLSSAISETNMSVQSTGVFQYNYTCDVIGIHKATIVFYNTTDYNIGSDTANFECGNSDEITWGVCPSSTNGYFGMWILTGFIIILGIVGLIYKFNILSIASGAMMFFFGLKHTDAGML